jgi:hypothetical protein
MLKQKFVTNIWSDTFNIDNSLIKKFDEWVDFEKTLDPEGRKEPTTQNGWQYSFTPKDKVPEWLEKLQPQIKTIKEEIGWSYIKSSWVVDYNSGGFQDAHYHAPENNLKTIIVNIRGEGDLLLFDPRPMAVSQGEPIVEIVNLKQGDWIAIPGWLVHSTRPCSDRRSIYVLDVYS